jgi:hypothetical protein
MYFNIFLYICSVDLVFSPFKKNINQIVMNSKYVYNFERTADTVFFCGGG